MHEALPYALAALLTPICMHRPAAILVPAYEGGHPDHDSCSFVGALARELTSLPVWEMPLYHRSVSDELECQRFLEPNGTEVTIRLTATEIANRSIMIAGYSSQLDLGAFIHSNVESFRPQPQYDYSEPPHEGALNYERWGWPISARQICEKFQGCMAEFQCARTQSERPALTNHIDSFALAEKGHIDGLQA